MFQFNHQQEPAFVDTQAIDTYQTATDPKTQAETYFIETWRNLQLAETHPWQADDATLMQLGCTAVAYANDRLAEFLLLDNRQTDEDGQHVLSPEVHDFALTLSRNSYDQTKTARDIARSAVPVSLDRSILDGIQPERMLPLWPYQTDGGEAPTWQYTEQHGNYAFTEHPVTQDFVRSVLSAARELQGTTHHYVTTLDEITVQPTPAKYDSLNELVETYLKNAEQDLIDAEGLLDHSELTPEQLTTAYHGVHDSYVNTMFMFTAVFCPPVLGPEWEPDRSVNA